MSDPALFIVSIVITVVICGLLYFVRRGMESQAWRDFLGITMAFVVLGLATFAMIVGEHALG
jgi:uncharacterized protein (DUF983 family)